MAILLILTTILAYAISVQFDIESRHTTDEERNQKCKLIPSEVILLTIPINIGYAANPGSVVRFIPENDRAVIISTLVLFSILVYLACFSQGKRLHGTDRGTSFGAGTHKRILVFLYGLAGFYLVATVYAGTL